VRQKVSANVGVRVPSDDGGAGTGGDVGCGSTGPPGFWMAKSASQQKSSKNSSCSGVAVCPGFEPLISTCPFVVAYLP